MSTIFYKYFKYFDIIVLGGDSVNDLLQLKGSLEALPKIKVLPMIKVLPKEKEVLMAVQLQ